MHRSTLCVLAAMLCAVLVGCGGGRRLPQTAITGETEELRASLTVQRADAKWFIGTLSLENISEQTIEFQPSHGMPQSPTFLLSAAGGPSVGARHGAWHSAQAAYLQRLPPRGRLHLELKWRHIVAPRPARGYPWTMSVIGMRVDDEALPDLVLRHP